MKFVKLLTVLGLALLSMQCFASELVCERGLDLNKITREINNRIITQKVSTRPLMVENNGLITICVVAN